RARTLQDIAVMRSWQPTMAGSGEPERLEGQRVSASYFRVLGVAPLLGRDFSDVDDRLNGPRLVVLSHALWQRRFNRDPSIVGRVLALDGREYQVIGVMPPDFEN